MNDAKSYASPFELGKPITGGVIAKVKKSNTTNFKENDIVTGNLPWQQHCIATENSIVKIDTTIASASYFLGVLGMDTNSFRSNTLWSAKWNSVWRILIRLYIRESNSVYGEWIYRTKYYLRIHILALR